MSGYGTQPCPPANAWPSLAFCGEATLHLHLDHKNCLEVLVVRGKTGTIKKIADELIAAKVVKHGKLTVTSSAKDLPS